MLAIVPIKDFRRAKSRLSGRLSDDERQALAEQMARHVLGVLRACESVTAVVVVTDGEGPARLAAELGAEVVGDPPGEPGLAAVVGAGLDAAMARGAESAIVVMADLPSLGREDIAVLVDALRHADVVLAPDAAVLGTSALALRPVDAIPPRFGEARSLEAHLSEARARGLRVVEIDRPGLAHDVDVPEDFDRVLG